MPQQQPSLKARDHGPAGACPSSFERPRSPPPLPRPCPCNREDIEELAGSAAVKEEQIEVKLAAIEAEWATTNLIFAGGPAGWAATTLLPALLLLLPGHVLARPPACLP
jgi:hypothetical protein